MLSTVAAGRACVASDCVIEGYFGNHGQVGWVDAGRPTVRPSVQRCHLCHRRWWQVLRRMPKLASCLWGVVHKPAPQFTTLGSNPK